MGLRNRINVLLKSQFNYWVALAEDPEKIINQALEEMGEGLDKAKSRISALRFKAEEEGRLLLRIREQISFWRKRAEELVRDGMEENAKGAVRKRRILEGEEQKLTIRLLEDEKRLKEMELTLHDLENRVHTAKSKKKILIKEIRIRKGTSDETDEIDDCRTLDLEEPFRLFRKMEERVQEKAELVLFINDKNDQAKNNEERLVEEEIEFIKRKIKEGGEPK